MSRNCASDESPTKQARYEDRSCERQASAFLQLAKGVPTAYREGAQGCVFYTPHRPMFDVVDIMEHYDLGPHILMTQFTQLKLAMEYLLKNGWWAPDFKIENLLAFWRGNDLSLSCCDGGQFQEVGQAKIFTYMTPPWRITYADKQHSLMVLCAVMMATRMNVAPVARDGMALFRKFDLPHCSGDVYDRETIIGRISDCIDPKGHLQRAVGQYVRWDVPEQMRLCCQNVRDVFYRNYFMMFELVLRHIYIPRLLDLPKHNKAWQGEYGEEVAGWLVAQVKEAWFPPVEEVFLFEDSSMVEVVPM